MTDEDFLLALKEYIEGATLTIEWEFGSCRSLEELIANDEMPNVYSEVVRRLARRYESVVQPVDDRHGKDQGKPKPPMIWIGSASYLNSRHTNPGQEYLPVIYQIKRQP